MSRYRPNLFRQGDQGDRADRGWLRSVVLGPVMNLPSLEMDPHDICPKPLHFLEVGFDLRPLLVPILFQKAAMLIVIVVEAPRHERAGRNVVDETSLAARDLDPFQGLGPGPAAENEADHDGNDTATSRNHGIQFYYFVSVRS